MLAFDALKAADAIEEGRVPPGPESDDDFHELACLAYGEKEAEARTYARRKARTRSG